jgi:hypothetical protein
VLRELEVAVDLRQRGHARQADQVADELVVAVDLRAFGIAERERELERELAADGLRAVAECPIQPATGLFFDELQELKWCRGLAIDGERGMRRTEVRMTSPPACAPRMRPAARVDEHPGASNSRSVDRDFRQPGAWSSLASAA